MVTAAYIARKSNIAAAGSINGGGNRRHGVYQQLTSVKKHQREKPASRGIAARHLVAELRFGALASKPRVAYMARQLQLDLSAYERPHLEYRRGWQSQRRQYR